MLMTPTDKDEDKLPATENSKPTQHLIGQVFSAAKAILDRLLHTPKASVDKYPISWVIFSSLFFQPAIISPNQSWLLAITYGKSQR